MCCRGLRGLAIPAYLGGFLCSALLRIAPYCAPAGIRVVSILPSYLASTKGFLRCRGINARRRVSSASPSCLPQPSSRRAGFRPLPLPGLDHIERHANEAVGSRAAVTQNACAGEDPTDAAPVGAGGIPARTPRSPPWPCGVCGRSINLWSSGWMVSEGLSWVGHASTGSPRRRLQVAVSWGSRPARGWSPTPGARRANSSVRQLCSSPPSGEDNLLVCRGEPPRKESDVRALSK